MRTRSLIALAAIAVTACSKDPAGPSGGPPAPLTSLPRSLSAAEQATISAANDFSFALFREVARSEAKASVFLSPMSASMSLGMTLNGARGETFEAMRAALRLGGTSQEDINAAYKSVVSLLSGLDSGVQFTLANSIWHTDRVTFAPAFLDAARNWFDASVRALDFSNESASLAAINGWVNDRTQGKIPTIIDRIPPDYVMYLINAIHFKGSWRTRFDPALTAPAPFHAATGAAQSVPFMNLQATLPYAEAEGVQVVDLPYSRGAWSMTIVLPPAGTTADALAANLTLERWNALVGALSEQKVQLALPKLKLAYERQMRPDLTALGMGVAFSDAANFSGMTSTPNAFAIGYVKQKTFVDVNEEGTEAAAATVTGITVTSAPMVHEMRVDRPYLVVIRERLSGTILFIGKINQVS